MDQTPPQLNVPIQKPNSGLAIWSLVLGILGLTCFYALTAIPAVICGHMAYARIRRSAGALGGQGLALAGLITGYIGIAMSIVVIPLLAAITIPNFIKARTTAQTHVCIANLRQIDSAVQMWALENKKENDTPVTYNDISPYLPSRPLVCPAGGTSFGDSYSVTLVSEKPTCLKSPETHKLAP